MVKYLQLNKLFTGFFLIFSIHSNAQNLHFLSVINTDNYDRQDRRIDAENTNKIASNIAKYMNYTKYTYDFGDSINYNPQSVKLTLQSLKTVPCSDDIIWFHYSGFGGNYGENVMPTMNLFGGELDLKDVENILRNKNPKLLLITIDCSNLPTKSKLISNQSASNSKYSEFKKAPAAIKPRITVTPSNEIPYFQLLENYNKLFKTFKGTRMVLMMAAAKNEDALSDSRKGSLWVQSFGKAINEIINNKTQKDIWEKDLQEKLQINLSKLSNNTQHSKIIVSPNSYCEDE